MEGKSLSQETYGGVVWDDYFSERYEDRDWSWYGWLLADVLRYSAPGPVLDVGAGHGLLVEAATRWGLDCTGIEGSEVGVRLALERDPSLKMVRGLLQEPLPFDSHAFQTAILHQVLQHLDPETARFALKEVLRILRPGGMIYVLGNNRFADLSRLTSSERRYQAHRLAVSAHEVVGSRLIGGWPPRLLWRRRML